jgi:alkylation response protein AidB-like acyl-CoA dehydrogenase
MEPGLDRLEHQSVVLRYDRELWRVSRVQSIFGGTTEIMKEIIGRNLGL